MQDKNCCESRRFLVELGIEIFKGKEVDDSHMQSDEWISKEGIRQIIKMRGNEKLERQALGVLQEIQSSNSVKGIQDSLKNIQESSFFKTIKDIADYKVKIIRQADIFEDFLKGKEQNFKEKFVSMVISIFSMANRQVKDQKSIPISYPLFHSIISSAPFLQSLKMEGQKTLLEQLQKEIQYLSEDLIRCRQRIKQAEYENASLREQFIKKKSEKIELLRSCFENAKKIEQKKAFFQSKQFFHQQTMTINREYYHGQAQTLQVQRYAQEAQTQDFQKTVAGYMRPLQDKLDKIEEYAQTWKRKYEKCTEQLKEVSMQLDNMVNMYRQKDLFKGQIFDGKEYHKEILIRHIESKGGKMISKTRLLYRFDPFNSTNFHKYIDGVQGIALIVKSKKGFLFGAYYSGKFEPEKILDKFGLLISISNDASYPLKESEKARIIRAVIYDQFLVIFGNADIRLAPGRDCIFSNFGKSTSFYKHEGKKTIDFLGEQNQQVQLQTYQFYEVRLNNEA